MRYLVKAKVKANKTSPLVEAIENETLGRGSIAGDEYLHNMRQARVNSGGVATWVETCFCDPPLEEERPYWEKYFDLLSVKDAHLRRNCRHETERKHGHAATAIALKSSRKNLTLREIRFSKDFARKIDKCRGGRVARILDPNAAGTAATTHNTSTYHDASICSLIAGTNAA